MWCKMKKLYFILISLVALLAAFCVCASAAPAGASSSYVADLQNLTVRYQMSPSTTQTVAGYNSALGALMFENGSLNAPYNEGTMIMEFEVSTSYSDFVFESGQQYNITIQWSGGYSHPDNGGYRSLDIVPSFRMSLLDVNTSLLRDVRLDVSSDIVTEKSSPSSSLTGVSTLEIHTLTYTISGDEYAGTSLGLIYLETDFSSMQLRPYYSKQFVYELRFDGWTSEDYPTYGWIPSPSQPEGSGSVTDHNQAEQDLITNSGVPLYENTLSGLSADGSLFVQGLGNAFGVFSAMTQSVLARIPQWHMLLNVSLLLGLFALITNLSINVWRSRNKGGEDNA